jgi:hypothetical protein
MLLGVAAFGVTWALSSLFRAATDVPLAELSGRMLSGGSVDLERLRPALAYLDQTENQRGCRSRAVGDAALIRLYGAAAAEEAGLHEESKRFFEQSRRDLRAFLACSPQQAYHWYGLFWVEMARGGNLADLLPYLTLSYKLAPREGWLATIRIQTALAYYDEMDSDLQEMVRAEYRLIVRDDPRAAAQVFQDAGETGRAWLLNVLENTPLAQRRELADYLDNMGIVVDVPGVAYARGRVVREP